MAEASFNFHTFEVAASYLKSPNKYRHITGGFIGTAFDLNKDLASYSIVKPHPCRTETKITLPAQGSRKVEEGIADQGVRPGAEALHRVHHDD